VENEKANFTFYRGMYISPVIIGTAIENGACGFITGIGHLSDLYDLSVELS
jgi:hypothetical protein